MGENLIPMYAMVFSFEIYLRKSTWHMRENPYKVSGLHAFTMYRNIIVDLLIMTC